ncbi:hypothetical protein [Candidatus Pollutiaquabacter sp.]|uniref:hypothetical protein n=1 Tax=Candidatus Pollutiaquabacter sp. TaxID=3416354 RepID=UPI003C92AA8F|nr:hypothetical protein [Bacteroidota bacterium]
MIESLLFPQKVYSYHCTKQSVGGLALLTLPSGWLVRWQAKANVPNLRGIKNFNLFLRVGKK